MNNTVKYHLWSPVVDALLKSSSPLIEAITRRNDLAQRRPYIPFRSFPFSLVATPRNGCASFPFGVSDGARLWVRKDLAAKKLNSGRLCRSLRRSGKRHHHQPTSDESGLEGDLPHWNLISKPSRDTLRRRKLVRFRNNCSSLSLRFKYGVRILIKINPGLHSNIYFNMFAC